MGLLVTAGVAVALLTIEVLAANRWLSHRPGTNVRPEPELLVDTGEAYVPPPDGFSTPVDDPADTDWDSALEDLYDEFGGVE